MIKEKLARIKKGELTAEENIKSFLEVIKKEDKKINAVLYVDEKGAIAHAKEVDKKIKSGKAGRLAGLGIIIKSVISVTGMPISCASKTLEDYYGTYDADVIQKIRGEDGIIIGLANCDEFASGSSGENSAFGVTQNPAAPGRIPGGSSSGSAAAVTADMCDIALGSDTGGSIRTPASHCGIIGIKPSYGRVSRYGLADLSMSLDQIGPLCKDVYGAALMMEIISGKSRNDATTYNEKVESYSKFGEVKKLRIGLSPDLKKLCKDKEIQKLIEESAKKLAEETNSKIVELELKNINLAIQTYYPIVYVEFFSATRKLDGRKYGKKIEDSCGEEALRRILGGQEISKAEHKGTYYRTALKTKSLITKELKKAFEKVDVIISPVTPILPHKLGEKITDPRVMYAYDAFTIPANLAGLCAASIPAGKVKGVPVGMHVIAESFKEKLLFDILNKWQKITQR